MICLQKPLTGDLKKKIKKGGKLYENHAGRMDRSLNVRRHNKVENL